MTHNNKLINDYWHALLEQFRGESSLIAFSGGVDSTLVAYAAGQAQNGAVLLVFCRTALTMAFEEEQAYCLAKRLNLPFRVVDLNILDLPEVANNRATRCYVCKKALFSRLIALAKQENLTQVADGSNADDLASQNRPGNRAARELRIIHPLAKAGLGKAEVRALAAKYSLPNHNLAARPCLATRFPYNTPLDAQLLTQVAQGEQILSNLGCQEFRLRIHNDLCRIEANPAEQIIIRAHIREIESALKALGWRYITLDLGGLKSGCFDGLLSSPRGE
ncbi:MAG: ATP-dependent sacrificial sulfur transferase LarE [Clostridiales bacterium]|nr:ATP-dependent sacrificial sulfur transferase LarE [Clostridiales bacterium]